MLFGVLAFSPACFLFLPGHIARYAPLEETKNSREENHQYTAKSNDRFGLKQTKMEKNYISKNNIMRKILLSMVVVLLSFFSASAQDKGVSFKLQANGSFLTEDGKDYDVIQYDGLSAHEIYQKLCTNVGDVYNSPNKVMSSVEDFSIKIRALFAGLVKGSLGASRDAYYQFQIKIKDGRVRVEAPIIENELVKLLCDDMAIWWPKYAKKWLKNEKSAQKNKDKIFRVEVNINSVINGVLGYSLTKENKEEDNW